MRKLLQMKTRTFLSFSQPASADSDTSGLSLDLFKRQKVKKGKVVEVTGATIKSKFI